MLQAVFIWQLMQFKNKVLNETLFVSRKRNSLPEVSVSLMLQRDKTALQVLDF